MLEIGTWRRRMVGTDKTTELWRPLPILLFICSEAVESKIVILETDHTVILPPYGECSLDEQTKIAKYLRFYVAWFKIERYRFR